MQNTSETYHYSAWIDQQEALIASLRLQPVVVVLRPDQTDFETPYSTQKLFELIGQLHLEGVRHIEVAWSSHPNWIALIRELNLSFSGIYLGAASITNLKGLETVSELGLDYAMSPVWDLTMQIQAQKLKKLLIPGVFSPSEIQQAKSFGWKLVKLFPASTLGITYINYIKDTI